MKGAMYEQTKIEEPESLRKLRLMTEGMAPSLGVFGDDRTNVLEYDVEGGTAIAFGLWKNGKAAVARTFLSAGVLFPAHSHNEKEFVVVFSGHMEMTVGGKTFSLLPGDATQINAGQTHSANAIEDTWLIAVTVPCAEGYPEGP